MTKQFNQLKTKAKDSYLKLYITHALSLGSEVEQRERGIALGNILHRHGVEDPAFVQLASVTLGDKNIEAWGNAVTKPVREHVSDLIRIGQEDAIARDVNILVETIGLTDPEEIFSLRKVIADIYHSADPLDKRKLVQAYTNYANWNNRVLINAEANIFNHGSVHAQGVDLVTFLQGKVAGNSLSSLAQMYAKEISLLHDVRFTKTTGEEILYRGIPAEHLEKKSEESEEEEQAKPMDQGIHDTFAEGVPHLRIDPKTGLPDPFTYGIKSAWWDPGKNTKGVSTGMFLPNTFAYATSEESGIGWIYVIKPPKGVEVGAAGRYVGFASRFQELTFSSFPSEWIKERVQIQKVEGGYVVLKVEPNPFFDKSLDNLARLGVEGKSLGGAKKSDSNNVELNDSDDDEDLELLKNVEPEEKNIPQDKWATVGDVLKEGTRFTRNNSPVRKLQNVVTRAKNALGKGGEFLKSYGITTSEGKTGTYEGAEQKKLYKEYYAKDPTGMTSKSKPKYENKKDFKKKYTVEKLNEHRFDADNHPVLASEQAKLYRKIGLWPAVEGLVGKDKLEEVKAHIRDIAKDYYTHGTTAGVDKMRDLPDYHQRLTEALYGKDKEYSKLPPEDQRKVHTLSTIAIQRAEESLQVKVRENNQNPELSKGKYGGIGARIGEGTMTLGDGQVIKGFLVNEVFEGGAAKSKQLKEGQLITAVWQDGKRIDLANLSVDEATLLIRGEPGSKIKLEYMDTNGERLTKTMERGIIRITNDSKEPERGAYEPLKVYDKKKTQAISEEFKVLNDNKPPISIGGGTNSGLPSLRNSQEIVK